MCIRDSVPFTCLVARIVPKAIVKKIQPDKNLYEWKADDWKEFFRVLQNDYMTATEQWNEECRTELKTILKQTALDYFAIKYRPDGHKIEWNFKEFHVEYKFLNARCKVGKYYLRDLLKKSIIQGYYFNENVMKPVRFCQAIFFLIW
eukprot:TRINITY_DN13628_c0_g1_i1.p1 TRINITY_DN13628_c0_g1~~TRINITY_DN13628_c0_g1_i1.p1  ORF type:complete len:147 (-),score=42.58 TRINITY_DN13628_c0_g1_i1:258-698(-)